MKTTGLWLIIGTSISMVYWFHFWMLNAKNVKTIAARIVTVKTAPERDGPRNIENELVRLVHDAVLSHGPNLSLIPAPTRWAATPTRQLAQKFIVLPAHVLLVRATSAALIPSNASPSVTPSSMTRRSSNT